MPDATPKVSAIETACHALMGAGLGAFLAAGAIVANDAIFNLVVNSPSPLVPAAVFVGVLSSQIAVGSAITGFILCSVERS
jgi:hypothetical protein